MSVPLNHAPVLVRWSVRRFALRRRLEIKGLSSDAACPGPKLFPARFPRGKLSALRRLLKGRSYDRFRCRVKAKFHYTDPTRTRHGPDTDKVRARCRVRAKFHYADPTGPARTQRSFAAKKVRAGPCGSDRVRVGSV